MTRRHDPRYRHLEDFAASVTELVDEVRTAEVVDWWPHGARRSEQRVIRTSEPGLLTQLRIGAGRPRAVAKPAAGTVDASWLISAAGPVSSPRLDQPGSRGKPGSRPPGSLEHLDCLHNITAGADLLRADVRKAAQKGTGRPLPPEHGLREVVGLLGVCGPLWAAHAAAKGRQWVSQARIVLHYDAPMTQLRDVVCPECGGVLIVREDASSDVRCAGAGVQEGPAVEGGRWPVPHNGCGATWPRTSWVLLLDAASGQ